MTASKVYFTDFRTVALGDGLAVKLRKLCLKAGINKINMKNKFVAIKTHFGEKGNLSLENSSDKSYKILKSLRKNMVF